MQVTAQEKRRMLRRSVSLPVCVCPDTVGELIDLSERGLRFRTRERLRGESFTIRIKREADSSVEVPGKIVWQSQATPDYVTYGVYFNGITAEAASSVDDLLLQAALDELLDGVQEQHIRDDITKFFLISFKRYRDTLAQTDAEMKNGLDRQKALERVIEWNDYIVERGDKLEAIIGNKLVAKKVKDAFRQLSGKWVYQSIIARHAFIKPRGYPGDAQLMEMIYANEPLSDNIGWPCDIYFLRNPYADAVRDRKEKIRYILKEYFANQSLASKSRILNIACGSAHELRELADDGSIGPDQEVQFTLVDQDSEALAIANKLLKQTPSQITVNYQQHNVLEYIKNSDTYRDILGKQDIIYTIGLADYLPDRLLQKLISFFLSLLADKGRLIIAHKDIDVYRPLPPDWWCDWTFYPRNQKALFGLLDQIGVKPNQITASRGHNDIILFLDIIRA